MLLCGLTDKDLRRICGSQYGHPGPSIGYDRDVLWSITNSGIWIPMMAPTCSTMISSDEPRCRGFNQSRMQFPLSIGMLLARDSIVGISIPSSISLPVGLFTRSVVHHPATNSLVTLLARLIVMCITERAQGYLSDNRSDKS